MYFREIQEICAFPLCHRPHVLLRELSTPHYKSYEPLVFKEQPQAMPA